MFKRMNRFILLLMSVLLLAVPAGYPAYAKGLSGKAQRIQEIKQLPASERFISLDDKGTLEDALALLPGEWEVVLEDGSSSDVPVSWECLDDFYDDSYSSFVFQGSIADDDILGDFDEKDLESLRIEISYENEVETITGPGDSIHSYRILSPNSLILEIDREQQALNGGYDSSVDTGFIQEDKASSEIVLSDTAVSVFKAMSPGKGNYLYNQLSDTEKVFYDNIDKYVTQYLYYGSKMLNPTGLQDKSYTTSYIEAPGLSQDEALWVARIYLFDNPQAFFLGTGYWFVPSGTDTYLAYDVFPEVDTPSELKEIAEGVAKNVKSLTDKISSSGTKYERAKQAHDLLCEYVDYDYAAVSNSSSDPAFWVAGNSQYDQSLISVFSPKSKGLTVCAGYSKSYSALMRSAGFDSFSVTSLYHEWNKVKINGQWYCVDTTWDDQSDGIIYNYFLKSDESMLNDDPERDHEWDDYWDDLAPKSLKDYDKNQVDSDEVDNNNDGINIDDAGNGDDNDGTETSCDSHIWGDPVVRQATLTENGSITYTCSVCGETSVSVISHPADFSLSGSVYTYDGSAKEPSVTVRDTNGTSINSSGYDISYTDNTDVGTASATVTFKGNYSGTKTLTFTINPPATSLSSVTAKSKGFTLKWKKQASQVTGYEIQYSTNSGFKNGNKTVTIKKAGTVSKTISKLKGKKKYYIRIRTYKTAGGKTYYSDWSSKKTVTTKK